ncbi:MAG: V-type ATP synthase subunit D [Thermoplasmata archaeon]|nr:MAG: V-type ATP synthase subunit D [Thermoplasmata archaeon]HDH09625.1 V-type ATP synthase subunit D [Chloroflexota bacterium]
MPQIKTAPTRSNLLRLKRELALAQEGYELLDEKREALIMEVMGMVQDAEAGVKEMNRRLDAAYKALRLARMSVGTEKLEWIALSALSEPQVRIAQRSIMGVSVPIVEMGKEAPPLQYGLGDTTAALDEAVRRFHDLLPSVCQVAEMLTAVWRLTREIKKTQRRVNALENIFIPNYQATLKFIEETLEEKEREDLFRMKRLRKS